MFVGERGGKSLVYNRGHSAHTSCVEKRRSENEACSISVRVCVRVCIHAFVHGFLCACVCS